VALADLLVIVFGARPGDAGELEPLVELTAADLRTGVADGVSLEED